MCAGSRGGREREMEGDQRGAGVIYFTVARWAPLRYSRVIIPLMCVCYFIIVIVALGLS